MPGDQVPEVAVLELLAQVPAQRQEPQAADDLGAGPAGLSDPGQVVPGQPGPVRQQVNDRQAVARDGIVQPDAGHVIPQRPVPFQQSLINEGANGRRGERLGRGPDGEQRVLGDRQPRLPVPQPPPADQLNPPAPDGGNRAPGNLPRGKLLNNKPLNALHASSQGSGFCGLLSPHESTAILTVRG